LVERNVPLNGSQVAQEEVVRHAPAIREELGINRVHPGVARISVAHVTILETQISPAVEHESAVDAGFEVRGKVAPFVANGARVAFIHILGGRVAIAQIAAAPEYIQRLVRGDEGCVNARMGVVRGGQERVAYAAPGRLDIQRRQFAGFHIGIVPYELLVLKEDERVVPEKQDGVQVLLKVWRQDGGLRLKFAQ